MVNDKQKMAGPIREKAEDYGGELAPIQDIHGYSPSQVWPDGSRPRASGEEMVRGVLCFYLCHSQGLHSEEVKALLRDPLTSTLVEGAVDISCHHPSGFSMVPAAGHSWSLNLKATLTFVAKFLQFLVRSEGVRTKADNQVRVGTGGHGSGIGSG
ncbi:hypothetical protein H5410_051999 [Solanum commersonii]|uniref:Uncharacterized protein n=1 Tax=Solanum commersonii TaxID=4109 RepID=A0A9J5X250_SOLCO|nr:hypothetical protein H5410_051999 [Solanum commersonii]